MVAASSAAQRFVLFQSLHDVSQSGDNNWEQIVALLSKGEQAAQRAQLDAVAAQFASGQQIVLEELRGGGVFLDWELRFMQLGLAVGNLGNVYLRLAEHYRLLNEFQQRLRRAARLPLMLVLGFALLVPLLLLLTGQLGAASALLAAVLGLLPLAVLALCWRLLSGRRVRPWLQRQLYRLPGIGEALARYQSYHYINHLAECIAAGFQLPQALKQSARRMPDSPVKGRYEALAREVAGGQKLSSALLESGILRGIEMPAVGAGDARQVPAQLSLAIHRACEEQLQFWSASLPYVLLGLIPYLVIVNVWFLLH
ncbi:hypothetical protein [Spongiibacter sp.]|uniref:hypothetical protein n=1 Tax=Spongiibacter sp. TaxID=2024860 RepID=UPI003566F62E